MFNIRFYFSFKTFCCGIQILIELGIELGTDFARRLRCKPRLWGRIFGHERIGNHFVDRKIFVRQIEAAVALGMTKWQALRHVIVPQAVRLVMPPVTNDFIALFKDTSVCSVITVIELTKRYSVLALSSGRIVELAAITAILYLAMSWPLSLLSRRFETGQEQRP